MKLLVCGSRAWTDKARVWEVLDAHVPKPTQIICGYDPHRKYPPGPDEFAYEWARARGVDCRTFPYLYALGKRGGYVRNAQMQAEGQPDKVLAFWDGRSRGTKHMIEIARKAGVPVEVVVLT